MGNDDDDKGKHGNEGNDSKEGHEDDEDDKNGDGCNDATDDVIFDCAAGTQSKAPSGANLADSPLSCWGCNKKLHSSVLCGDSILNLLSNNPSFIGMSLNNGRIIELDDNNETRTLCCICIAPLSAGLMKSSIDNRAATMLLPIETRKAAMLVIHPPTGRMQYLGLCNCDWVTQCCVRKKETPDRCTFGLNSSSKQCSRPVHFECQVSWERYARLSHEKKCTYRVCREHHPEYQLWQEVDRKPVDEHEKEARAKEAVNSFVWAREGEHKGAVVHQCQLLDRIAEKGQVWVKWTSTGKIVCTPQSNIEKPTQGREQKRRSVVTHVEVTNQKKQQKSKSTGDAKSPVTLLTETTIPQHSRNTRSSGAKRVDDNVNVAQETMMPAVLVGTADVNDDFESPDNDISQPTEIGPVNSATVVVTVDDVNAEVNSKLRAIEAMDLMEHGEGGDSDKEGYELDFHNDAERPRVTLCAAKSNAEGAVSDDDLDSHCYFDSPCYHRWNKTEQHRQVGKEGCSQWGFAASTMTPQHHTGSAIPRFPKIHPRLHIYYSIRMHPYAHPQHLKVLKHFVYIQYGCGMLLMGIGSLNHGTTTLYRLGHIPFTPTPLKNQ